VLVLVVLGEARGFDFPETRARQYRRDAFKHRRHFNVEIVTLRLCKSGRNTFIARFDDIALARHDVYMPRRAPPTPSLKPSLSREQRIRLAELIEDADYCIALISRLLRELRATNKELKTRADLER
jgi:hypothetical protein